MFITVTAIRINEDNIEAEFPLFLNLDSVESIDLVEGKMTIFYKQKEIDGEYNRDILKNSLEEISKKLKDVGLLK